MEMHFIPITKTKLFAISEKLQLLTATENQFRALIELCNNVNPIHFPHCEHMYCGSFGVDFRFACIFH